MFEKLVRNKSIQIACIFLFWTLIAIISASQLMVRFADRYDGGWLNMFLRQLPVWYPWALLTPIILYITTKYDQLKLSTLKQIGLNLATAVFMVLVYNLLFSVTSLTFYEDQPGLLDKFLGITVVQSGSNLLIYLMIMFFGYSIRWYQELKNSETDKLELKVKNEALGKELAQAQLQNLKMQLHPHFLFNTMHTIASLVRTGDQDAAVTMLAKLSSLLRVSMKNLQETLTSLQQEINFIRDYLEIEKTRFQDRLLVQYEIHPDTYDAEIPALILQPLIENCIKHGLKDVPEKGTITIKSIKANPNLVIEITDNGVGFKDSNGEGIGLQNVRNRLQNHYPGSHQFMIESIHPGTRFTITYPYQPVSSKEPDYAFQEV